jgi:hypothetical protein
MKRETSAAASSLMVANVLDKILIGELKQDRELGRKRRTETRTAGGGRGQRSFEQNQAILTREQQRVRQARICHHLNKSVGFIRREEKKQTRTGPNTGWNSSKMYVDE